MSFSNFPINEWESPVIPCVDKTALELRDLPPFVPSAEFTGIGHCAQPSVCLNCPSQHSPVIIP